VGLLVVIGGAKRQRRVGLSSGGAGPVAASSGTEQERWVGTSDSGSVGLE
jgi:hypothetical protein